MKVGTYNILGMTGYPPEESSKIIGVPGEEKSIKHFANVFQELDCDILALQEGVTYRTINQVAELMNANVATFPSPCKWPGHIVTKFPILESRTFRHFTPNPEKHPLSRCGGAALLQINKDMLLWAVVVHLYPHNVEGRPMRIKESKVLGEHIDKLLSENRNMIIMGDYNCEIEEEFHDELRQRNFSNAMEKVSGTVYNTIRSIGERRKAIDHIYVSSGLADYVIDAEVVTKSGFHYGGSTEDGVWVHSDHLPVTAELKL